MSRGSVDDWLREAARQLAARASIEPEQLAIGDDEIRNLLDAAGRAAHESGARTNAPLYCYLLGRASTLSGIELAHLQAPRDGT
jgi:hypothetical protein